MKKLSIIVSAFCLTTVVGQKVSDYKYVSVPEKFQAFKGDYGMKNVLTTDLKSKNYIVLPSDQQQWPAEATSNPCNVINADILNDTSFLRNRAVLQFKDCKNKVILTSASPDLIKFADGYEEALTQSLVNVPVSRFANSHITAVSSETLHKVKETATLISKDKGVEKYHNGNLSLQRIQLDDNQFILADSNSSLPFATFKGTAKKDIFRVKLANGDFTIGYFEGKDIIIEFPQVNGEYSKEVFSVN